MTTFRRTISIVAKQPEDSRLASAVLSNVHTAQLRRETRNHFISFSDWNYSFVVELLYCECSRKDLFTWNRRGENEKSFLTTKKTIVIISPDHTFIINNLYYFFSSPSFTISVLFRLAHESRSVRHRELVSLLLFRFFLRFALHALWPCFCAAVKALTGSVVFLAIRCLFRFLFYNSTLIVFYSSRFESVRHSSLMALLSPER